MSDLNLIIPMMAKSFIKSSPTEISNHILNLTDNQLAEEYRFNKEVGYGNWGSVWEVEKLSNGKIQAVKLVHRKIPSAGARVKALWSEYKLVRSLQMSGGHPNIIQFQSFVLTPGYALISMPILDQIIPISIPEVVAKIYLVQLVSAVSFLHSLDIVHNDIKVANIMLTPAGQPILIDFGFSTKGDSQNLSNSIGTPEYSAPEVISTSKGTKLSDIFSLGVSFYEIVVGRTCFEADTSEEFLDSDALKVYHRRTLTGNFYGDYSVSNEFETLIKTMIHPSTSERMQSIDDAFSHRFFAGFGPSTPPRSTPVTSKKNITPSSTRRQPIKIFSDSLVPRSASKSIAKRILGEASNRLSESPIKSTPTISATIKSNVISPLTLDRSTKISTKSVIRTPPKSAQKLGLQPVLSNNTSNRSPARLFRKLSSSLHRSVSKVSSGSTFLQESTAPVVDPAAQSRERLDSFTKQIQDIIDSKVAISSPIPFRSIERSSNRISNTSMEPILSSAEVKRFVNSEREREITSQSQKKKVVRTSAGLAPRPSSRSSSRTMEIGRAATEVQVSTITNVNAEETLEIDCFESKKFRKGHTRIPTAIRNVPAVTISDSPDSPNSDRAPTPAPLDRIFSEAFVLPIFVPVCVSSEEEDTKSTIPLPSKTLLASKNWTSPKMRSRNKESVKSVAISVMSNKTSKSSLGSSPNGGSSSSKGGWRKMFMR